MNNEVAGISIHEIVNTYSDTLIRIAYQNTKNISDAEDIVQEVFIKLIHHVNSIRNKEHLKAWLIRVTINRCKDYFKSSWINKTVLVSEDPVVLAEEENDLMSEILELEPEDKNIIYLYYYEGYKIKEIAKILKLNKHSVSSKLQRARKKLKGLIEEEKDI